MVRDNDLKSAYLWPLVFYGAEGMGLRADNLKAHAMVAAWYWGPYLGTAGQEGGDPHPDVILYPPSCQHHHVA